MPWAPDESGQWQWYASPLLAPQAGGQPGQQSWNQDPTGTGPAQGDATQSNYGQPITTHYNPMLSATDQAASDLAAKLGGKVVSAPMREAGGGTPGSSFNAPNANYIQFPNGTVENAGQLLQWAGQYGVDSQQFQTMVQQEQSHLDQVNPTEANWWQSHGAAAPQAAAPAAAAPTGPAVTGTATLGTPGGGQTWYQDPTTSNWQFGQAPAGAATSGGGTAPTAGQGGSAYAPKPRASSGNTPGGTSFDSSRNFGGYGVGETGGMSGGSGSVGPEWGYDPSNNPKDILANDRKYAYTQGGKLLSNFGDAGAAQDQRARSLGGVGDDLYSWMLSHPGYTPEQASAIMNEEGPGGLKSLDWTDQMADSNFLDPSEQAGMRGDPNRAVDTYGQSVPGLQKQSAELSGAVDPSKLGVSDAYKTQHQFGAEDQQALIEDAGRTVGQGTAAVTDQLQRQAAAAGTNAPLAMGAALDRQRQTGAVASADAMTKAKIQAAQLGLTAGQEQENTRLGAEQDISGRQMQIGQEQLAQGNRMAEQRTGLAGSAEIAQQQRAQAIAQNRQQTNQANQGTGFTRGSYQDQARSQRATQGATASRNDLTSARQDVRNEEQTANNESNSRMAGQLQAFTGTTGAGQASQQNAITAAQMPSTLQKIAAGLTSYATGGVATEPTMARLGELGPEIVIKLKPSRPMSYQRRGEMANAA